MFSPKKTVLLAGAAIMVMSLGTMASRVGAEPREARAVLRDAGGDVIGSVYFVEAGATVRVKASVDGAPSTLLSGFHGFHIHWNNDPANGSGCSADRTQANTTWFVSADGHYNPSGAIHGEHAGDMPVLLVDRNGKATLRFRSDRFDLSDLERKAVIVHAGKDNYANIPASRTYPTGPVDAYHSHDATANPTGAFGPDNATKATGDAGFRFACGIIRLTS